MIKLRERYGEVDDEVVEYEVEYEWKWSVEWWGWARVISFALMVDLGPRRYYGIALFGCAISYGLRMKSV